MEQSEEAVTTTTDNSLLASPSHPWFHKLCSRAEAEAKVGVFLTEHCEESSCFLVRNSHNGSYAVTFKSASLGILHAKLSPLVPGGVELQDIKGNTYRDINACIEKWSVDGFNNKGKQAPLGAPVPYTPDTRKYSI
eukprot:UC4_evm1s245